MSLIERSPLFAIIISCAEHYVLVSLYSITENELVPLKSQLEEVELHIGEQVTTHHTTLTYDISTVCMWYLA